MLAQVYETWIQERRLEYAKLKLVMAGFIIRCVKKDPMGPLLTEDGKPNRPVLETLVYLLYFLQLSSICVMLYLITLPLLVTGYLKTLIWILMAIFHLRN